MQKTELELHGFFDQYLRTIKIPHLECEVKGNKVTFVLKNAVDNLRFPIKAYVNGKEVWFKASTSLETFIAEDNITALEIDENFYLTSGLKK